jgi:nondiscriminating glutamyl-tRNA synthetase
MHQEVRVRFAPSPTGSLHVGGARTAIYNWLFARRHGGRMVLRIEDTDVDREKPGALQAILDGLRWLGVSWDEGPDVGGPYGPYQQSQRLGLYRQKAQELVAKGWAYPCYCTPEELQAERDLARAQHRPPGYGGRCRNLTREQREELESQGRRPTLRLNVHRVWGEEGPIVVEDAIRGTVSFPLETVDDFVILKSNGMPTYNFAVTVDDSAMRITHVIRADEHLSNTPKQVLVAKALGVEVPVFAHLSMVLAPDRTKLSKRHGATGVEEFRAQGYLPEALANYLMLLGWSFPDEREIFGLEEAAQVFDLDRVSRTAAVYDVRKLTWMNGQYLRRLDAQELLHRAWPFLEEAGLVSQDSQEDYVARVLELVRERAQTLRELADACAYFFRDVEAYDPKGAARYFVGEEAAQRLEVCREAFASSDFTEVGLEEALNGHPAVLAAGSRAAFIHTARLAVTGRTVGPGLFQVLALLGRERVLWRLEQALRRVRQGEFAASAGPAGS